MVRSLWNRNINVYVGSETVEIEHKNGLRELITLEDLYLRQEECI